MNLYQALSDQLGIACLSFSKWFWINELQLRQLLSHPVTFMSLETDIRLPVPRFIAILRRPSAFGNAAQNILTMAFSEPFARLAAASKKFLPGTGEYGAECHFEPDRRPDPECGFVGPTEYRFLAFTGISNRLEVAFASTPTARERFRQGSLIWPEAPWTSPRFKSLFASRRA